METVGALLAVIILSAFYVLPTIIGWKKRNAVAICALNLLLGWTFVGWVVALIWALTVEQPKTTRSSVPKSEAPQAWVTVCAACKSPVNRTNKFCPECGAQIDWQQVASRP